MKRLIRMLITTVFTLAVFVTASFAWFTNSEFVEPNISGYSVAAYFGGGDGSLEKPFLIKNQRHLYNLAWLQYLGYFNKKGSGIVEDKNSNKLTQFSFSIENDINMEGWNLPPIGTNYNPFIGFINGNNHTISNLKTTNNYNDFNNRKPGTVNDTNFGNIDLPAFENASSCSTIGFIGSIGETSSMNHSECSIDIAPTFTNLVLKNTTVVTNDEKTLIGSVAGYVNGVVADIGVVDNKLTFNKSANPFEDYQRVSNYTVVGYAEEEYTTQQTRTSSYIYNPTYDYTVFNFKGMGDQSEWGGSMDMYKLYTRTKNSTNGGTTNPSYVYREIRKQVTGKNYDRFDDSTYTLIDSDTQTNTQTKYYDSNSVNGAYLKDYVSNSSELYQSITTLYKDVYTITIDGAATTGYKIHDGNGHYLGFNKSTNSFINSNESNATIWLLDSNGLYTYNDEVYSETIKYYLNGTTSLKSTLSTSSYTIWSWDDVHNTFMYTYENNEYYLKYFNGQWSVNKLYYISDGTNYLGYNNNTITNYTSQSTNALWEFLDNGTIKNANNMYLRYNNGLQLSQTATVWNNNNGSLNYNGYYIQYQNSNWVAERSKNLYITQEVNGITHYLTFDYNNGNPRIVDTTNKNNATIWNFSTNEGNPSGTITTTYNNITYYIYSNNNTLSINTTSRNWSNSGSGLNYNSYYIIYDNGWKLSNVRQFYIYQEVSGVKHYLSLNGANIVDQTNETNATRWSFSTFDANNPSGKISATSSNSTYYLYIYNGSLTTTTNSNYATSWNNGDNGIYYNYSYIHYDGNKWGFSGFYISHGTNYLSINGTSVIVGNEPSTLWYISSDNYLYTIINNTNYYIGGNRSDVATLSTSKTSFNYPANVYSNNGNLYVGETSYQNYRLNVNNNSWVFKQNSSSLSWYLQDGYLSTKLISINFEIANIPNYIENIFQISKNDVNTYNYKSKIYVEPSIYNYIPINADATSPYAVSKNNTGYIMAGGYEGESQTDIRISQFTKNQNIGWGIRGSFNSSNNWITNKIYTVGANGVGIIKDSSGSTTGTVYDNTNNNNLLFKKLKSSKETLQRTLADSGDYVYGLHFMDAKISKEHLVQPEKIKINGVEKDNYQMPEDCIDFHLKTSGIINFFSGYYYASQTNTETPTRRNDAFFSLHEILRDSNDRIIQIRHILEIYEKDGQYIYYYEDDDSSETGYYSKDTQNNIIPKTASDKNGWTLKFNYNWIEDPENSSKNNNNPIVWSTHRTCVFYFEIPVHKGEYALGSVDGKNGTYLMYLDIGANAAMVDRTKISEVTKNTTDKINYVNGIQILDGNNIYTQATSYEAGKLYYERTGSGTENDPYVYTKITVASEADFNSHSSNIWVIDIKATNSAVAYITTINSKGDVDIGRTVNTITIGSSLNSTYCGDNITLNCTMDINTVVTTINKLRLLDYNRNTKITYESKLEFVSVTANNATTNSKSYTVIDRENPNTIITNNSTTNANIEAGDYGLLTDDGETIYNQTIQGKTVPVYNSDVTMAYYGFTDSKINTTTDIIHYDYSVNTYKQNVTPKAENQTSEVVVIDITDDNTSHQVTKTLDNQLTTVVLEKAYKVGGNTITVTTTEATTVTVKTYDTKYTFVINGTTVDADHKSIEVTAS